MRIFSGEILEDLTNMILLSYPLHSSGCNDSIFQCVSLPGCVLYVKWMDQWITALPVPHCLRASENNQGLKTPQIQNCHLFNSHSVISPSYTVSMATSRPVSFMNTLLLDTPSRIDVIKRTESWKRINRSCR